MLTDIETAYHCCVLTEGRLDDVRAVFEHSSHKPLQHCPRNWSKKRNCKNWYIITEIMASQNCSSVLFAVCLESV
jgi:hypothetical protein